MSGWPVESGDAGKFVAVHADPPYAISGNSKTAPGRNPRKHYQGLSIEQLCTLPLADRVAKSSLLFLWMPTILLAAGAHVPLMSAWGFRPVAFAFCWSKLRKKADPATFTPSDVRVGLGHTTRKSVEVCLLGRRGKDGLRRNGNVHEVIFAPVREHSRKPDEVYRRIEQYLGLDQLPVNEWPPMLDLFCRESRPGWTPYGDQKTLFDPMQPADQPLASEAAKARAVPSVLDTS